MREIQQETRPYNELIMKYAFNMHYRFLFDQDTFEWVEELEMGIIYDSDGRMMRVFAWSDTEESGGREERDAFGF